MENMLPKISIVTATYNCAIELEKTANSIRCQTFKNIEWIVVDGASTDLTINVIKNNLDIISNWHSEIDKGIYDAWNKASKYISGEWVIFLGAGDVFNDYNSLKIFCEHLPENSNEYDLIYGNVYITNEYGKIRYLSRKPKLNFFEHGRIALPNHQGVFHSVKHFKTLKPFDENYKIAGDSKFLMKILKSGKILHIDLIITQMQDNGVSNNIKNILLARNEINNICKELNIIIPYQHKFKAMLNDYFLILFNSIFSETYILFFKKIYDKIRS